MCIFDSIPFPIGVFIRDGVLLDESDPRITVETTATTANTGSSTLRITNIRGDESGVYNCNLTNIIGTDSVEVATIVVYGKTLC